MKSIITFTEEDHHDDDYGKILPAIPANDHATAKEWLLSKGFTENGKNYVKVQYHSILSATIHPISELTI